MAVNRTYQLHDVLDAAWRHRLLIAAAFVLTTAAVMMAGRWLPDWYRAEATILVAAPRIAENYVRPTVTPASPPPPVTPTPEEAKSIAEQLLPRERVERVVREFRLYERPNDPGWGMKQRAERLRDEVDLKVVRPDTIRLSWAAKDRYLAWHVTQRLATLLVQDNLREREVQSQQAEEFLRNQLEDARRKLQECDARIETYEREHAGELAADRATNEQALQAAQMQIQVLDDSISRDRARLVSLERAAATLASEGEAMQDAPAPAPVDENGNSTAWQAASQLETARAALRTMAARLTAEHPDVVRQKRLIRELEAKAQAESRERAAGAPPRRPPSTAEIEQRRRVVEMQAEIAAIKQQLPAREAEQARLRAASELARQRLQAIPGHESELGALQHDRSNLQQTYAALLAKQQESTVAANVERWQASDRFKVLEPAQLPKRPDSPNRVLIDIFGVVLGLGVALGAAALVEYFDTTVRTEEELAVALGLPVLATVPPAGKSSAGPSARVPWTARRVS